MPAPFLSCIEKGVVSVDVQSCCRSLCLAGGWTSSAGPSQPLSMGSHCWSNMTELCVLQVSHIDWCMPRSLQWRPFQKQHPSAQQLLATACQPAVIVSNRAQSNHQEGLMHKPSPPLAAAAATTAGQISWMLPHPQALQHPIRTRNLQ